MDLETKLEVLTERVSNLSDQLKRFISHLESEQRVTGEISKRVDQLSNELNHLQKQLEDRNKTGRWRIEIIIAIAALVISAATNLATLLLK